MNNNIMILIIDQKVELRRASALFARLLALKFFDIKKPMEFVNNVNNNYYVNNSLTNLNIVVYSRGNTGKGYFIYSLLI